jgi:hypothetical protein
VQLTLYSQFWPRFRTNTISKMFLAGTSGGRSFALRVIPGLIVVALAAWAGALGVLISG